MKAILITLVEGVTMLFAAFGGFLNVVAPPPGANDNLSAAGLASFAALIVFAVIKLLLATQDAAVMRRWIVGLASVTGAAFVFVGFGYFAMMDTYTFRFPEGEEDARVFLVSDTYTEKGQMLIEADPNLKGAHAATLSKAGELQVHDIWAANKIVEMRALLTKMYVGLVVLLSLSLGFSIEGLALTKAKTEQ